MFRCAIHLALLLTAPFVHGAESILREWTFSRPGDLQGWQPNAHLTAVGVTNGILSCKAAGGDPILELAPSIPLAASPWRFIEVRLRADRDGACEFFWSHTTEGPYHGFSQALSTRFHLAGDRQWHTCRVFPFWHSPTNLIRLRLDLYDAASFQIDHIRLVELAMPEPAARAEFGFTNYQTAGWQPLNNAQLVPGAKSVSLSPGSSESFFLSPPLATDAVTQKWVSFRLALSAPKPAPATEQPLLASLLFATQGGYGWHSFNFPVEADDAEHTYNLDMVGASQWRGKIIVLGLRPPGSAALQWLRVSDRPQGPPELKLVSCVLDPPRPRAGHRMSLDVLLTNPGGLPVTNLSAELRLASPQPGFTPAADLAIASLAPGRQLTCRWTLAPERPFSAIANITIRSSNAAPLSFRTPIEILPKLSLAPRSYVPEPKPVRGPCEVGAYYFPGWKTAAQWRPLQRFPERKPLLGWYREGDPEVADWHIKWAVEHGITFFAYDWYWSQGARQLEHALHDGYFKARYRSLLKFCLLWANHNPPHTSSTQDCLAVTQYWIDNYFRRAEYLAIDRKPVVIIFTPFRLAEDLGSSSVKSAFEAMRGQCRRAGLSGMFLLACVAEPSQARAAADQGYDAVTAYNWAALGMPSDQHYAPFQTLIAGYRQNWELLLEQSPIPLLLPITAGWDSRPWHGENNLVRFGRTPALFQAHLQDAWRLLSAQPRAKLLRNFILIEAWNEWGEGSYIEPHQQYQFAWLDAIRHTFTTAARDHLDLTPADLDLGPYEVPDLDTDSIGLVK